MKRQTTLQFWLYTYNQHFPYRWKDLIEWRERKSNPALADRWERCNRRGSFPRQNGHARHRVLSLPELTG